jgi:hypothetical protein
MPKELCLQTHLKALKKRLLGSDNAEVRGAVAETTMASRLSGLDDLEYHPRTDNGKRPDFTFSFNDKRWAVEVSARTNLRFEGNSWNASERVCKWVIDRFGEVPVMVKLNQEGLVHNQDRTNILPIDSAKAVIAVLETEPYYSLLSGSVEGEIRPVDRTNPVQTIVRNKALVYPEVSPGASSLDMTIPKQAIRGKIKSEARQAVPGYENIFVYHYFGYGGNLGVLAMPKDMKHSDMEPFDYVISLDSSYEIDGFFTGESVDDEVEIAEYISDHLNGDISQLVSRIRR